MDINYVDFNTTYFDVFVWCYWPMTEEVSNINTEPITGSADETYIILIGEGAKFFLVNLVQ